jgi:hypothetical protein
MSKRNGRRRRVKPLPVRRWDQMTDLIEITLATAFIENCRQASLVLFGTPGMGKTELLERWRLNRWISYHSDMTVRQLYPMLRQAERGQITHLVFTEFQKLFQRKGFIAENCVGTMAQAIEEGVQTVSVGPQELHFENARLGILGAMTGNTYKRQYRLLSEMGFLDRVAFVPFDLSEEEIDDIMHRINAGDRSDLTPKILERPAQPVAISFPERMGEALSDAMKEHRTRSAVPVLRTFQRLRSLTMAATMLRGASSVGLEDIERVMSFHAYLLPKPKVVEVEV